MALSNTKPFAGWNSSPTSSFHSPLDSLELRCGQGGFIAALAHHVSTSENDMYKSPVDVVDPIPLDYGNPKTLGQTQLRPKASNLDRHVKFHCAIPVQFRSPFWIAGDPVFGPEHLIFDIALICYSLWCSRSRSEVLQTLTAVRKKCKILYIAEWPLTTGAGAGSVAELGFVDASAYPHILIAITGAAFEAYILTSN
ncbi:hypothetical protein K504DRAFT_91795 [Pleomassaria siparia CBS 279.74]|uniref:Uncharacterized protein n=1 Tax=Pleomassaria siparia CBS 279.74 TaxID=1314801 RepID=A0A6G1JY24_9PLEO|nr:hypothetical protein K504DRAFT_91795 [Pleomassaria siparia CBS 279.74]